MRKGTRISRQFATALGLAWMAAAPVLAAPSLVYSTFLGGIGADEGNAIAVTPEGRAYVVGRTVSPDFPTSPGAVLPHPAPDPDFPANPVDAFATGLTPTGALEVSTYLGGPHTDIATAVAVGPDGGIYVAGMTFNAEDIYTFVAKLHPSGQFFEYFLPILHGSREVPRDIAVDSQGNAWVTGIRLYDDASNEHVEQAFAAKVSPSGALLAFTLLDGSGYDEGTGIVVDAIGDVYVAGFTTSDDLPYSEFFQGTRGGTEVFVIKLDSSGEILGTALLGGSGPDQPTAIAIGPDGRVFISGWTGSANFPTTAGALQGTLSGPRDLFALWFTPGGLIETATYFGSAGSETSGGAALDPAGRALLAGTGSSGCVGSFVVRLDRGLSTLEDTFCLPGAEIRAIDADAQGDAYVTGVTQGAGFPVVNAFQPQYGGNGDAFVTRISFNQPPDCSIAFASPATLWPPNGRLVPVSIRGVTDPNGDPVTLTVTGVRQDEPLSQTGVPDAVGIGTAGTSVRADRDGKRDGRVYHIAFEASDGNGGVCTGTVTVCVPHDQGRGRTCGDGGPLFPSGG